jgi:PAS domain S-box-containing protein
LKFCPAELKHYTAMSKDHPDTAPNYAETGVLENQPALKSSHGNEELFRFMVESVKDYAIFATDTEGRVVSWNRGAQAIFGYTEAEIIGQSAAIIFTPEDIQSGAPEQEMRTAETEGRAEDERWHVRRDGSRFWASGIMTPLRDEAGNMRGFVKVARDNTQGRLAEQALRQREEELTDFFENAAVGLHWVGPDGTILRVNQAELDLLGYTREEYLGHNIVEFHVDEGAITDILQRLTANETLDNYEARLRCKDGSIRHVLISSNVRRDNGKFVHTRCFTRDITERKRFEDDLRGQTETLETVNRVGQLLTAELDQQKLVQAVTDAATRITGAHFGSFFYNLIDERGESFMLYTLSGVPREAFAHFPMPRNTDIFNPTFKGEGTMLLADVKKDPRYGKNSPYYGMPEGHLPVTSYLAVPVISRSGEVIGGLFFGHPQAGVFTERAARIVEGLASQAAIAMDNARLFDVARRERTKFQIAQQRYGNILESITDAFYALDHDWRFTYMNRQAEALLQRTRDELLGQNVWEKFPETVGTLFDTQYHQAIAEQVSVVFEEFYSPLSNWYEVHAYPSQEGLSVYFHNITERRRNAEALVERTRLAELNADIGLALTGSDRLDDMLGLCTKAIVEHLDAAFARIWTLNNKEQTLELQASAGMYTHLDGSHGRVPIGKYKIGRIAEERKPHLTNEVLGDTRVSDQEWAKREGMVSFAGYPLIVEDRLIGVMAMFARKALTEATFQAMNAAANAVALGIERKRGEEERAQLFTSEQRARQEAEAANRTKDEFLGTLSHELRTPLTAILGWARMLSAGQLDESNKQRALETIERNARAQSQLIEDILDVSRVISGKLRLEVRPLDLATVIDAAVDTALPAADAKDIRLQRVLDSGASMVSGDSTRLQQVVWNLLANAIKFTPRGGRVQIRLERINSHVEIVISDTGQGMSSDILPFIFERFRQADSTSTRAHGGLGLGLAIVRHLVELHGGTVEAESAGVGQGSIFTVKLPLIAMRSVDLSAERREERVHPTFSGGIPFECPPVLNDLHVLVVDDEEDARAFVTTVLEQCGARVTGAGSAAEALLALKELRPDVLVSDLGMPEEDGYSLIKKVRALSAEEGGRTPAAALTAYARVEDRMKVLRSGFQIHLPKPIEPAELVTVVANLTGRITES